MWEINEFAWLELWGLDGGVGNWEVMEGLDQKVLKSQGQAHFAHNSPQGLSQNHCGGKFTGSPT